MPMIPVVTRQEWGAIEPKYEEPLSPPVELIVFHGTGKKECLDKESCIKLVKKLQKKHLDLGLPDILYNFLIGGDGTIYEGRGWETLATKYPNTKFDGKVMDVAYLGPYKIPERMPPQIMLESAVNLVNWGRIKNVLIEDCLRSDVDLQTSDIVDDGDKGIHSDTSGSDIESDDLVDDKNLEDLNLDYGFKPPTAQDIIGTQPDRDPDSKDEDSDNSDVDSDDSDASEEDSEDSDDSDSSEEDSEDSDDSDSSEEDSEDSDSSEEGSDASDSSVVDSDDTEIDKSLLFDPKVDDVPYEA